MAEARANAIESRVVKVMEEYKDFDTFKIDAATAATIAYILKFDDYKKKIIDAFSSLDLHRITPMGELEENEEEDEGWSLHKSPVGMTLTRRLSRSQCLIFSRQLRL